MPGFDGRKKRDGTLKIISKQLHLFVTVLLLVGFYYSVYRYPFKISDSGTSPFYRDTPVWLSLGKYLLIGAAMACTAAIMSMSEKIRLYKPFHAFCYLSLWIIPVAYGLFAVDISLIESGIFFSIPLIFHFFSTKCIPYSRLTRIIAVTLHVAILFEMVQIALYLLLGRLPALSYANSVIIRFGSFLDDPNGFGVLLALFICFSMAYYRGLYRFVILALLFLSLLLTQSLTALVATPVAVAAYGAAVLVQRPNRFFERVLRLIRPFSIVAAILVSIVAAASAYYYRDHLATLYERFSAVKAGSIAMHLQVSDVLSKTSAYSLLGFRPQVSLSESGYIDLLTNFGIVYVLVYLITGLLAIRACYKLLRSKSTSTEARAFASGSFGLLVAIYVAFVNLPLERVFPLNLFLALFMGLISSGILHDVGALYREPRRDAVQHSNVNA